MWFRVRVPGRHLLGSRPGKLVNWRRRPACAELLGFNTADLPQRTADTVLKLNGAKGQITLECEKQKDGKPFETLGLKLRSVDLPDGSSCVVDVKGAASDVRPSLLGSRRKVLNALITLEDRRIANDNEEMSTKRSDWRHEAAGVTPSTFERSVAELIELRLVEKVAHGRYELTAKGFFELPIGELGKY